MQKLASNSDFQIFISERDMKNSTAGEFSRPEQSSVSFDGARANWVVEREPGAQINAQGYSPQTSHRLACSIIRRLDLPSQRFASNVGSLTRSTDRCGRRVPAA